VSLEYEIDLSRIESHILEPNYLLMLGSKNGWVPLRVLNVDPLQYYLYDPVAEGTISGPVPAANSVDGINGLGWQPPVMFGSKNMPNRPVNVLKVLKNDQLYQIFIGISPKMLRIYRQVPAGTSQASIDVMQGGWNASYNQFGWIDGRESPFASPSPRSEMIIPPTIDVAFAMANPTPEPVHPLFNFVLNRVKVGVVADIDLIDKMLSRKVYVKYYNLGGLIPVDLDIQALYGIQPISLNATKEEIKAALSGGAA
jgi:hypothetical protein